MVVCLSLWSQDPSCAALGPAQWFPLRSRRALTQWLWVGFYHRKEIAPQLSPHPKSATCLICPGCKAALHGICGQEEDMSCTSWGPAGTQPATILSLLSPATATPGGHCHPGVAANGAGHCWGRFVFPSPVINPWQIREAPGEQTRPGQSKNASSQPRKQFHVQDSPSPEPLPSWHCLAAPRRCRDKERQAGNVAREAIQQWGFQHTETKAPARLLRHLLACCPPQPALLEGLSSVLMPQPQN